MPINLEIVPLSRSVDMFGSVHTSTAYSLSGHVLIHLTPSMSLFESQSRPSAVHLTSLTLTFEGKSECVSPQLGYNASRLCHIHKDLIKSTDDPVALIPSGGSEEKEWNWEVVFDLAIPGWLPSTTIIEEQVETSYALYASATFAPIPEVQDTALSSHSPFAPLAIGTTYPTSSPYYNGLATLFRKASTTFCSIPLSRPSSKPKQIHAQPVSITITRHRIPPSSLSLSLTPAELSHPEGPALFPPAAHWGSPGVRLKSQDTSPKIPLSILRGIDVILAYPEFAGVEEGRIPVSLRVKTTLDEAVSKKLRLHEFDVEVDQIETFRGIPCSRFVNSFPLPPPTQQPPSLPLLDPHPYEALYDMGLVSSCQTNTVTVEHPLVPDGGIIHYRPQEGEMGIPLDDRWSKMDVCVPLTKDSKWIRPQSRSPFHSVIHEIRVALSISYNPGEDDEDKEIKKEMIYCEFPIRFTHVESSSSSSSSSPTSTNSSLPSLHLKSTDPSPTTSVFDLKLPAYSQLFYENGDRKEDDGEGCWLPVYKPKESEPDVRSPVLPCVS